MFKLKSYYDILPIFLHFKENRVTSSSGNRTQSSLHLNISYHPLTSQSSRWAKLPTHTCLNWIQGPALLKPTRLCDCWPLGPLTPWGCSEADEAGHYPGYGQGSFSINKSDRSQGPGHNRCDCSGQHQPGSKTQPAAGDSIRHGGQSFTDKKHFLKSVWNIQTSLSALWWERTLPVIYCAHSLKQHGCKCFFKSPRRAWPSSCGRDIFPEAWGQLQQLGQAAASHGLTKRLMGCSCTDMAPACPGLRGHFCKLILQLPTDLNMLGVTFAELSAFPIANT